MFARRVVELVGSPLPDVPGARRALECRSQDFPIRTALSGLEACASVAELRIWMLRFARGLGFYGARYIHIGIRWWDLVQTETPLRFLSTSDMPEDEDKDWLLRDPSVARAQTGFVPFAWSTRTGEGSTELQRHWLERERSRGISAGVAVPVQDSASGPAYLSLFGFDEAAAADLIDRHAPELAFVAAQFHTLAKLLVEPCDWAPPLSRREIEILRLAALGKTYQESAEVLGVSHRTIEYHLRKASEKLGAVTKIRAVVLALSMGLTKV